MYGIDAAKRGIAQPAEFRSTTSMSKSSSMACIQMVRSRFQWRTVIGPADVEVP